MESPNFALGYARFSSETMRDFSNWGFRVKMDLLLLAFIFTFTIHRRIALFYATSLSSSKMAAIVSLLLWLTVGLGTLYRLLHRLYQLGKANAGAGSSAIDP
jgi:hypothetical protein